MTSPVITVRGAKLIRPTIADMLFGGGVPGPAYRPRDLSTLFLDYPPTSPVTAMEQQVACMLDISGNGHHAFQTTLGKRPVVSRRVNLITDTEPRYDGTSFKFEAADIALPSGVNAGTKITSQTVPTTTAIQFVATSNSIRGSIMFHEGNIATRSMLFYNNTRGTSGPVVSIDFTTGVSTGPGTAEPIGGGWWKLEAEWSSGFSIGETLSFYMGNGGWDATFGTYWYIAEPSVVNISDAHLPYQWVNTATDYDDNAFKFPTYLRCDGVGTAMQTNAIDFTGTDKMTVIAGLNSFTAQDGTALGTVVLHPDTGFSSFVLYAPILSFNLSFNNTTSAADTVASSTSTAATNNNAVVSGIGDLATRVSTLRVNSVQLATATAASGGGNYRNGPLHIGGQGVANRYFKGRIYGLIVAGTQMTPAQLAASEAWMAAEMMLPT